MSNEPIRRLGWVKLAIFSSPVLVFQAIELPWRMFLPPFFAQTLGLGLAATGALMMWIRLFDMVADPVIGWASDRFSTPFGLRRPWMVASLPLIVAGTWHVFFASPGTGMATIALWCAVMHLGYTLMVVPHGGWGLELSDDYHERTRIMGAKMWFAAAGMPLIILLPAMLERMALADRAGQIAAMGWILIMLAPISVLLVLHAIPEPSGNHAERSTTNPLRQFAAILADPALVRILLLYALVGVADASGAGTFVFFVEQAMGLDRVAGLLILIQAVGALAALPIWLLVSRRLGKQRTLMLVFAWNGLLAPVALLLPAGNIWMLGAFLCLRSLSWGADYMLLRALVADIAGHNRQREGASRSGSYYALFNVTLKLAAGLGIGAALWMIAWVGFEASGPNDAIALEVVRLVFALPSCLAGLIGVAITLFASSDRPAHPRDQPLVVSRSIP